MCRNRKNHYIYVFIKSGIRVENFDKIKVHYKIFTTLNLIAICS
jgi:hypothetical protein